MRNMAIFCYVLAYFIALIAFVQYASCLKYIEYNLTSGLCDPLQKKVIIPQKLNDDRPAIIVNSFRKFVLWPTRPKDYCDFVVETQNKHNGIFAVIQSISLRRINGQKCLDSVKFKREDLQGAEFCGQYNRRTVKQMNSIAQEMNMSDFYSSRDYSEFSPRGMMRTVVNISSEELQDFVLNLTIAYTIYKGCNHTDLTRYRRVARDQNICIPKELFCDGIYNCGGMDGCLDEEGCAEPVNIVSDETGTKVTVGLVTTILHLFLIFVVCLWICRRQKKLCWSPDCAGPSAEQNTPALSLDIDHRSQNNAVSTAPMLEVVLTNAVQDKDLPPSYDSLFPENTNLANQ